METLKEFRNILLGQKIVVHTDHKNLTCKNFNTDRVMRWRLILEEYGPELRYIKGEHNIVADALSRLDMLDPAESKEQMDAEDIAELLAADEDEFPKTFPSLIQRLSIARRPMPKSRSYLGTSPVTTSKSPSAEARRLIPSSPTRKTRLLFLSPCKNQ